MKEFTSETAIDALIWASICVKLCRIIRCMLCNVDNEHFENLKDQTA